MTGANDEVLPAGGGTMLPPWTGGGCAASSADGSSPAASKADAAADPFVSCALGSESLLIIITIVLVVSAHTSFFL